MWPVKSILLLAFVWAIAAPLSAEDGPYRVAAGVNLGGGQLDWRISRRWMLEARYQAGETSDGQTTRASLYGVRAYRFLTRGRPSFFAGLEGAGVSAKQSNTPYRASGWAAGAFGGFEFRLLPHLFFLADAGPYAINLKEERTGRSNDAFDFVGDLSVVLAF